MNEEDLKNKKIDQEAEYQSDNSKAVKEDIEEYEIQKQKEKNKKENKKKKGLKYVLYLSIILVLTILVLAFSLTSETNIPDPSNPELNAKVYQVLPSMFKNMDTNNWLFFALFFLFVILTFLLSSLILFLFARLYTKHYKYHQSLANNAVGVFYSNITPGSSGGQFAQAFTFKKQGMELSTSASILVMNFIVYQSTLLISGLISMIKIKDILAINAIPIPFEFGNSGYTFNIPIVVFVILGFAVNAFVIVLLLLMSYSRGLHNFVLNHGVNFFAKLRLIKNPEKKREELRLQVENFRIELRRLQSNIPFTILVLFLMFISQYLNYVMPCICGYALNGFDDEILTFGSFMNNTFTCFCYMNFHQMFSGLIPLPGGAGITEFVFNRLFSGANIDGSTYFSESFLNKGSINILTLLWRLGTFYIPFFVCGIVAATYKSRGLNGVDRFYEVSNSKKTFLTIQLETLNDRKESSDSMSKDNTTVADKIKNMKLKKKIGKAVKNDSKNTYKDTDILDIGDVNDNKKKGD
ncbi:MAG: flippase-like domain-containing protein [Erysipelotrichaceae bacterium]|nr:flippase-like domain-containing protein [Erysipelotrichaceae bacterium]MCB9499991.1 flippase-like domain-containing protein [Erysipelotrichaceae bacterium]